jgi:hypothetical protein
MNSSTPARRRSLVALGLGAGLALMCAPAFANHFGGGSSHSVGHSSSGAHFSGGSRGFAGSRGAVMRGSPAHFSAGAGRAYGGGFGVAGRGYAGYGGNRGYVGGYWHGGGGYWHGGGYWRGGLWYGGFLAALPLYYDMFWWGGVPYYYANDAYYVWSDSANGYTSVPPPGDQPPATAQADQDPAAANNPDLIVYPRNGQSPDQQARDRYECGHWAATQSGFNPAQPGQPGVAPAAGSDQYLRAEGACLEGRGYTVK